MSFVIERADERAVGAVAAIERSAFSDPWSTRSFQEALDNPSVYFACARNPATEVLGYVVAWFVADEGEIANLAVSPEAWGRGIGRALLESAIGEGLRRSAQAMYLEVRDSNARARALYASCGFEEIGRRRKYYRRPVEDAIVLRRRLVQAVT